MKKVLLLVSSCAVFTFLGCSGNSQQNASNGPSFPVVQVSSVPAKVSPPAQPMAALPAVSVGSNHQHWRSDNVKKTFGDSVVLKHISSDGTFDLVIMLEGTHSFLSLAKHARWETVRHRAARGKLINLRLKFEDGQESCIVWDELGFGTPNAYSVVWRYPSQPDSPVGQTLGSPSDLVGGDDLLIKEMTKHTTMLLEIEPGVTKQFAIDGLAREIQKARAPETEPVLAATQADTE